jgi:cell division GTPase FtsZ
MDIETLINSADIEALRDALRLSMEYQEQAVTRGVGAIYNEEIGERILIGFKEQIAKVLQGDL